MESMKRIDVLKGIEQILVQKAYETGHISHRADGDWQKQADGSWTPYTGQSTQSTPQAQESAPTQNFSDLDKYIAKLPNTDLAEDSDEVTNVVSEYLADHGIDDNDDDFIAVRNAIMEKLNGDHYGEITEEDLEEDAPDDEDDWDRYDDITDMIQNTDWESIVAEYDNPSVDQIMSDYDFPDDERIRDEISTYIHADDSDEDYGDDEVDYTYAKDIDYSQYDDDIKSIEFRENDNGELEPHDDDYFRVADKIYEQTDREDMSDEEADQLYDGIVDRVIDRAYELRNGVQKSAIRDMRSAPITKNMGF